MEPVGNLPSGFMYSLPRFESEILIMRRKAVAVGSQGVIPDIVLTESELQEAGI
jgi:hypothetical protein